MLNNQIVLHLEHRFLKNYYLLCSSKNLFYDYKPNNQVISLKKQTFAVG